MMALFRCQICKRVFKVKKELLSTEKYIVRDQSCRIVNYSDETGIKAYILSDKGVFCHNCLKAFWSFYV